ncbi:MAG: Cyclic nucleotide-gated potassium channel [bacterium ADurb.Bin429]|nr:MAG: Cyclic nucleotide-gated potassium channel [bacterium ADurb.Bin429]
MATERSAQPSPASVLSLRARWYARLEDPSHRDRFGAIINTALVVLIILNVLAGMLETIDSLALRYVGLFNLFEICSVSIFAIEYLLRLWVAGDNPLYRGKPLGRLRHVVSPMALIDLISILPSLLPLFFPFDLRFLRLLRLTRLLRILKLGRYSDAAQLIWRVLKDKLDELAVTVFVSGILVIVSSYLMYLAENAAQPEKFPNVIAALWWSIVTMTTVGYGDVFPITTSGKVIGCVITIIGIGLFALPVSILGAGFVEEIQKKKACPTCPHCGKSLQD